MVVVCVLLSAICLVSVTSAKVSWERTYGGQGEDAGYSVQQTADGGFIIAANTNSFGAGGRDAWLLKTNARGDTLWTRTYGGTDYDYGLSVQQTTDGGYIVVGYAHSFGVGEADVYLIKTNAQGDTLWTRTYGGIDDDEGWSVQQTTDGGYIIAGYTWSFGVQGDVWLIKTNASGDTLWTRTYGGAGGQEGYSVRQTTDGGYIIAGRIWFPSPNDYDAYLVKTNAQGDTLWTRAYGGPSYDWGFSARQTADGGYIVVGSTYSFDAGGADVYLIKTDASGDSLWTRTYGGTNDDYGASVQQTTDGGYIVAGSIWADLYLIKTDANIDVGPVAILSPAGAAESGGVYVPRAVVRGYNVTAAVFPVTMEIGSAYTQTIQETLAARLDTVVFPSWTAGPVGSRHMLHVAPRRREPGQRHHQGFDSSGWPARA